MRGTLNSSSSLSDNAATLNYRCFGSITDILSACGLHLLLERWHMQSSLSRSVLFEMARRPAARIRRLRFRTEQQLLLSPARACLYASLPRSRRPRVAPAAPGSSLGLDRAPVPQHRLTLARLRGRRFADLRRPHALRSRSDCVTSQCRRRPASWLCGGRRRGLRGGYS